MLSQNKTQKFSSIETHDIKRFKIILILHDNVIQNMNQLINLSGDYVTFDVGEKKEQKVKIVGTFKQPFFVEEMFAKYWVIPTYLHKHVKTKNKKDLKTLSDEVPVESIGTFFGSEHLKNLTKCIMRSSPHLFGFIVIFI